MNEKTQHWRRKIRKSNVTSWNSSANRYSLGPLLGTSPEQFCQMVQGMQWLVVGVFFFLFWYPPPDIPGLFFLFYPLCPNHWVFWERLGIWAGIKYLAGSLSYERSSAGSWGAYLGRIRDVKECGRAAAEDWEKHFFSVFTTTQISGLPRVLFMKTIWDMSIRYFM